MTLRIKQTRVIVFLACLLACFSALLLAGCGSGGSTAPSDLPPGTTATETSENPNPSATPQSPNQIPGGPINF